MKWICFISLFFLSSLVMAKELAEMGVIAIKTNPVDANIFIDGELKANTSPFILEVPAGSHDITAIQADKVASFNINVGAGSSILKELVLVPVKDLSDGNVFRDVLPNSRFCSFCPQVVWIPTAERRIGAAGIYEVTFEQYDYFAKATGRHLPNDNGWGRGKRPVINVNWKDAIAYLDWLSQITGHQYKLPTEAQWEYIARAGTKTHYWWGNQLDKNANCGGYSDKTLPVGSFTANTFGLYDTVGNVWEWVCSVESCLETNQATVQVLRGGSFYSYGDSCHVTYRMNQSSANATGFRVVRLAD